ncbi:MAG: SIS domain-containing protein, partial [Candidatus Nitrosothermus koennekii]
MLNKEEVLKVDSGQVYKVYEQWPTLAEDSMKIDVNMNSIEPSALVLAGMGGSGTSADVIYDILYDKADIPVYVIKGYHLPSFIDSNALMIAISSSGNTEETLSIFTEAHKKGLKIIGISSGGLLEKVCKDNNYMHLKIRETVAPRYSLPSILFAVLNVISNIEGIE